MAVVGERRTNAIIEKNHFFKNDNRFSEKNEINIPSNHILIETIQTFYWVFAV